MINGAYLALTAPSVALPTIDCKNCIFVLKGLGYRLMHNAMPLEPSHHTHIHKSLASQANLTPAFFAVAEIAPGILGELSPVIHQAAALVE